MAGALPVIYSGIALQELDEIALWNQSTYSLAHARSYIDFLLNNIDSIGQDPELGGAFAPRPELRYLHIRRGSRGYGHVVVYTVGSEAVRILHIFHSAQNWQVRLEGER